MLENLPKFHTLDIEYNGFGPFTAVSSERAGISVSLSTHTQSGVIELQPTEGLGIRLRNSKLYYGDIFS
jgi:hypothetical protein